jgi:GABA(A) receptor-associated protein
MDFKKKYTYHERIIRSFNLLKKYPDRIPIICTTGDKNLPKFKKTKYLVPRNIILVEFIYLLRKQINLPREMSMYLLIGPNIQVSSQLVSRIYEEYKDRDGFLYVQCFGENTFG